VTIIWLTWFDWFDFYGPFIHVMTLLNIFLNNIGHWCNLNNMAIIVTKSKVMFVTSKHNQSIIPQDFPGISYTDAYIYIF